MRQHIPNSNQLVKQNRFEHNLFLSWERQNCQGVIDNLIFRNDRITLTGIKSVYSVRRRFYKKGHITNKSDLNICIYSKESALKGYSQISDLLWRPEWDWRPVSNEARLSFIDIYI